MTVLKELPNPGDYDTIPSVVVAPTWTVEWFPIMTFDYPLMESLGSKKHDGSGNPVCDDGRPDTGMLYPRG